MLNPVLFLPLVFPAIISTPTFSHWGDKALSAWANTAVLAEDPLEKTDISLVCSAMSLIMPASAEKVQVLADVDRPFIMFTVRLDLGKINPSSVFSYGWSLVSPDLAASDTNLDLHPMNFRIIQTINGNWWDVQPVHAHDELWQRKLGDYLIATAVVRRGTNGTCLYIATEGGKEITDFPGDLWAMLQKHFVKTHERMFGQQSEEFGGVWKKG